MIASPHIRRALGILAIAALMAPRASAALTFNDGRDQVGFTAEYGISYDSNLFAHAGSDGDYNQSLSVGANYVRRAGLIGVNGSASVTTARFQEFSSEDFTNPALSLEFTKGTGRLTGALSLSGQRENRSDVAANLRADSWSYSSNLRLRYPINDRYYFTSSTEWSLRDYVTSPVLFNLSSYSEAIDVFYVYTSKLDLMGGYRVRIGEAQGGAQTRDHALTLGATGGILPKLNGSMRLGYQSRNESGRNGGSHDTLTADLSLSWPVTRQVTFTGQVSKDFMTTATDISVDATALGLSASLRPNTKLKLAFTTGVDYTVSRYLGSKGAGREDRALSFSVNMSFPFTARFSSSIAYAYSDNSSNLAYSDFRRHTASFNLTARF